MNTRKRKRRVGRPRKREYPEPINDTPENIAKAILNTSPRDEADWEYLQPRPAD